MRCDPEKGWRLCHVTPRRWRLRRDWGPDPGGPAATLRGSHPSTAETLLVSCFVRKQQLKEKCAILLIRGSIVALLFSALGILRFPRKPKTRGENCKRRMNFLAEKHKHLIYIGYAKQTHRSSILEKVNDRSRLPEEYFLIKGGGGGRKNIN